MRSLPRFIEAVQRSMPGRILTQSQPAPDAHNRYRRVSLSFEGLTKTRTVHGLVAAAFLGERPDGMDICHINGDYTDNRAANLRYDTHANNQLQMVADGTHNNARKTHCKWGHPFSPENTYIKPGNGARGCRTCTYEKHRRAAERKRSAA